jgi:hypothetical protein
MAQPANRHTHLTSTGHTLMPRTGSSARAPHGTAPESRAIGARELRRSSQRIMEVYCSRRVTRLLGSPRKEPPDRYDYSASLLAVEARK